MRLELEFVEPFKWRVVAEVPKEIVKGFKSLDELAEYIVDTYFYSNWVRYFDRLAEAQEMPYRKRWEAKHRYREKMIEYVKKWMIEAVMGYRKRKEREKGW